MKRAFILILSFIFIAAFLFPACTEKPDPEPEPKPAAARGKFDLGEGFGAAIKADGSLWTWGENIYGQLGNGTTENSLVPVKVMDDVVFISCGDYHMAAIKTDGSLWTWGSNMYSQLGNGGQSNDKDGLNHSLEVQTVPVKILDNAAEVYCGNADTIILRKDGELLFTGEGEYWTSLMGELDYSVPQPIMSGIKAICRGNHVGVIRNDDSLWMFGDNRYGQLMTGTTGAVQEPVKVMEDVLCCANCVWGTTAVLKKDGTLWTCGSNANGMLGNGGEASRTDQSSTPFEPEPVKIMDEVVDVCANGECFLALKTDGSVWALGTNELANIGVEAPEGMIEDRYGNLTVVPRPVKVLDDAAAIACGFLNCSALKADGSLWIWGAARDGAIGNGTEGNFTDRHGRPLQTVPAMTFGPGSVLMP